LDAVFDDYLWTLADWYGNSCIFIINTNGCSKLQFWF